MCDFRPAPAPDIDYIVMHSSELVSVINIKNLPILSIFLLYGEFALQFFTLRTGRNLQS